MAQWWLFGLSERKKRKEILAQGTQGYAGEEKNKRRDFRAEGAGDAEKRVFLRGRIFSFAFSYLCVTQRSLREDNFSRGGRWGRREVSLGEKKIMENIWNIQMYPPLSTGRLRLAI